MLIKDEIYVAHQLTDKEKLARDRERYNIDSANGDKIQYVHLNRPGFEVGAFKIEFDIKTRNWMLHLVKRMRWLRRFLLQWHIKERNFCNWYINVLPRFFLYR